MCLSRLKMPAQFTLTICEIRQKKNKKVCTIIIKFYSIVSFISKLTPGVKFLTIKSCVDRTVKENMCRPHRLLTLQSTVDRHREDTRVCICYQQVVRGVNAVMEKHFWVVRIWMWIFKAKGSPKFKTSYSVPLPLPSTHIALWHLKSLFNTFKNYLSKPSENCQLQDFLFKICFCW